MSDVSEALLREEGFFTVHLGGKDRIGRFSYNTLGFFCDEREVSLREAVSRLGIEEEEGEGDQDLRSRLGAFDLSFMVWACFREGARKRGDKFNKTPYDVGDWLTDASEEEMQKLWDALADGPEEKSAPSEGGDKAGKPT